MPGTRSFFPRSLLFPLFTGISLAVGFIVPSIYEWTQKPASRSRHYAMEQAALAVLVITIIACSLVLWLRRNQPNQPVVHANGRKLQFGLRHVFVVMTLIAVVLGITRLLNAPIASGLVAAVAITIVGWAVACDWGVRSRIGAILVSMFLPFTWMIAYNVPFGHSSGLAVHLPLGPGIFFAELLRRLTGLNTNGPAFNLAVVIVTTQLLLGAWLARSGDRRSLIYTILVFVSSSLSSLMVHALYRM